jgi:hypothetical protein
MPATKEDAAAWVQKNLEGWPKITLALATQLVEKYGHPGEANSREITWYGNSPWKRTVLRKGEPPHNFPRAHKDVLEQTVNYRVPPEKAGDLLKYNGSLVIDRTLGELSVHCDSEEHNILTHHLADDMVKGERTLEEALTYHAQVIRGLETHDPQAYAQKLKFQPGKSADTADPSDEAPLLRHLGE